ncbi:hypothetical protein O181_016602 [Austropuccinia psidii MF-1]|uniref:Uncharacterized protein n=1 Tax=Austropuccinia psidii MF-1 TaxID=1389203 RepID=A0A9Q3C4C4_9BASI|nr:hypothetical protein [Austropuccinia psidii MF-1]
MLPQIQQGVMHSLNILKRFLKEEEIGRYSNRWNLLSSKPQIKNIDGYHAKIRGESEEEDPEASTRKPQVSQSSKKGGIARIRIGGNHIPQAT